MVMSIPEKIASLKAEISKLKGSGAKEKKVALQKQIALLEEQDKPTASEKAQAAVIAPVKPVKSTIPPFKKTTMEEVQQAEKEGRLCGFDAVSMTASIREKN